MIDYWYPSQWTWRRKWEDQAQEILFEYLMKLINPRKMSEFKNVLMCLGTKGFTLPIVPDPDFQLEHEFHLITNTRP